MASAPSRGSAENLSPSSKKFKYDPTFTDRVIAATGPNAVSRLAQIMPSLIRHLHDFAREVDLTVDEWMAGVELINECGRMSTSARNETQLLCDILGLESLVDEISSKQLASSSAETPSAILGPFYRAGAPELPNGASIARGIGLPDLSALIHGRVRSSASSSVEPKPLAGATVDVWHAAPNGLYEQQDSAQPEMNLRGRFQTDAEGRFALYALRPPPYPIPDDGPAGRLLGLLDRHPFRPAHVHFVVTAPGHRGLTTQVFDAADPRIGDDAVFAVKDDLVRCFVERRGDEKARWELEVDFVLGPSA